MLIPKNPHTLKWMHIAAHAIILLAFIISAPLVTFMFRNHSNTKSDDNEKDLKTKNVLLYVAFTSAGVILGLFVVSILDLVHTRLTKVTPEGIKYISYKYSYLLALIISGVVAIVGTAGVLQNHLLKRFLDNNPTASLKWQNIFVNNRLVPYTLTGIGLGHVIGLLLLTFLPHKFDEHKKVAILATVASGILVLVAGVNFSHASVGNTKSTNQQGQSMGYLAGGLLLAGISAYFIFVDSKTSNISATMSTTKPTTTSTTTKPKLNLVKPTV